MQPANDVFQFCQRLFSDRLAGSGMAFRSVETDRLDVECI
jgi:hypothetical protein